MCTSRLTMLSRRDSSGSGGPIPTPASGPPRVAGQERTACADAPACSSADVASEATPPADATIASATSTAPGRFPTVSGDRDGEAGADQRSAARHHGQLHDEVVLAGRHRVATRRVATGDPEHHPMRDDTT